MFDPLAYAMQDAMREMKMRIEAEGRLKRAMKLLVRFEYGSEGACLECAVPAMHRHTDTCEVGRLIKETGARDG